MMIDLAITVGLASGYLVTAWREGSLFTGVIAWIEDDMLSHMLGHWFSRTGTIAGGKLRELLLCPLCLSPYVCLAIYLVLVLLQFDISLSGVLLGTFASAAVSVGTYFTLRKLLAAKEMS